MAQRGRFELHVDAPPADLFALYTDARRIPEWQPGAPRVLNQTGPLDLTGTRYTLKQRIGPALRVEVRRVEPPRLHEQAESALGGTFLGTARFEPAEGGTRLSFEYGPEHLTVFGRLIWRLFSGMSARIVRDEFTNLRSLAERERNTR